MRKSNQNILTRINDTSLKIKYLENDRVELRLGDEGNMTWLTENGQWGEGTLDRLKSLHAKYKQLSSPGAFARIGVEYSLDNKKYAFLATVENISFTKNGNQIVTATLEKRYKNRKGEIDNNDFTGSAFRKLHNEHSAPQKNVKTSKTLIHIDTWTNKELAKEIGGNKLKKRHDLIEPSTLKAELNIPGSLERHALASTKSADQNQSFQLLSFDDTVSFENTDATIDLKANITPSVTASLNTPDHWWQYTDPSKYSFDTGVTLDWSVSVTFNTGSNSGSFQLAEKTFKGPGYSFPVVGIVSGNLTSGLTLSGNTTIEGLQESYTLGVSQNLERSYNVSLDGVTGTTTDSGVQLTPSTVDPLTGFGLSASATPVIELAIGLLVPEGIPHFGGDSLASISGKLSLPVAFDFIAVSNESITIDVTGAYDATLEALTFLPGGGLKPGTPLASGTFFTWNSPNLLA